ncbi:MucR family transcriptional regulator [Patescibacteria group bacterium]
MLKVEVGVIFTLQEQALFEFQRQIPEAWGIPGEILDRAQEITSVKRGDDRVIAFAQRSRKYPVVERHYVEWEEKVRRGEIFGEVGIVTVTEDGSGIQCHLCGNVYQVLSGRHLNAHGLEDGSAYRELLGLNRNQPLAAPNYRSRRREAALEIDSAQYFLDKREPFRPGVDPRRQVAKRPQTLLQRQDRDRIRRQTGEVWSGRTGEGPQFRKINKGGRFWLNQESYFFSKRAAGPVEIIEVTEDKIVVRGVIRGGKVATKEYPRKR